MTTGDSLDGIARQRSQLGQAMIHVELAAAAPTGKESWLADLRESARTLEAAFNHHVEEVETPTGLLDRIVDQAPRLQRASDLTREDHVTISRLIDTVLEMTDDNGASTDPEDIREAVVAALLALTKHRQRGADLIYDAYDIDIGGY